jgi:hypothetical protein
MQVQLDSLEQMRDVQNPIATTLEHFELVTDFSVSLSGVPSTQGNPYEDDESA